MKKTLLLLTFLAVAGMSSTSAQAATHYVSGFGGVSWMQNMKTSETYIFSTAGEDNNTSNFDLDSGLAVTGAIGCDYGNYRLEAEVGFQTNSVKSGIDFTDGVADTFVYDAAGHRSASYAMRGDVSVLSLMGNGYYDFDLGSKVELYATAGVGVAQVSFHNVNWTESWEQEGQSGPYINHPRLDPGFNGHETTLAWQVGAGIAAPISDTVKLDLRYRYFATTDFTVADFGEFITNHETNTNSRNTNISSHSVLLGLRVDF